MVARHDDVKTITPSFVGTAFNIQRAIRIGGVDVQICRVDVVAIYLLWKDDLLTGRTWRYANREESLSFGTALIVSVILLCKYRAGQRKT